MHLVLKNWSQYRALKWHSLLHKYGRPLNVKMCTLRFSVNAKYRPRYRRPWVTGTKVLLQEKIKESQGSLCNDNIMYSYVRKQSFAFSFILLKADSSVCPSPWSSRSFLLSVLFLFFFSSSLRVTERKRKTGRDRERWRFFLTKSLEVNKEMS